MINGVHVIIDSTDVAATRKFCAEVLGLGSVDAGDGWLIFALPPAEAGIHPAETGGRHEVFFLCDDLAKTMDELKANGVEFGEVTEPAWGSLTSFKLPGAGEVGLYQPKHAVTINR